MKTITAAEAIASMSEDMKADYDKADPDKQAHLIHVARCRLHHRRTTPPMILDLEEGYKLGGLCDQYMQVKLKQFLEENQEGIIESVDPDADGREKGYWIYLYNTYTDVTQTAACKMFGFGTRQYRDNRTKYKGEWEDRLDNGNDTPDYWGQGVQQMENEIERLKEIPYMLQMIGVGDGDKWLWGLDAPHAEQILEEVRKYSGGPEHILVTFRSLKIYEYYVSLSTDERISKGLKA